MERLITQFPRVALGSSGQYADPGSREWWHRMAQVMGVACDADGMPRVKLHGLATGTCEKITGSNMRSADSCNVARNIIYDSKWCGPNAPTSRRDRILILANRIEAHASAARWSNSAGVQQNFELMG